jgi:hypothetical protein
MKTTFDLPDTLYRQVKIRAVERSLTVREIVIESLQRELALTVYSERRNAEGTDELYRSDEEGWPVFVRPSDVDIEVTDELVNNLRELEGV